MSREHRLTLLVTRALRDSDQLPAMDRADLFQAVGEAITCAANEEEDAAAILSPAVRSLRQRAEQALLIAFQIREAETAQLSFLSLLKPGTGNSDGSSDGSTPSK